MSRDMEQFGQRIKKKRKEKHLSQIEAAEKLGISPNHLSTLENGNSNPSFEVICDLCDLLDATPDYFFLGALHSNNLPQNIIDKLRLLPEDKQVFVSKFIELLLFSVNWCQKRQNPPLSVFSFLLSCIFISISVK